MIGPLLTREVHDALGEALRDGTPAIECSLDLDRSRSSVQVGVAGWTWQGRRFPCLSACKDRTIYYRADEAFQPAVRFTEPLVKLVPTQWGAPTFEIDGIKMLPTVKGSPCADAARKVSLIQPRGKSILDTCGGLGYFGAWCLSGRASEALSYERSADVLWLRSLNPWSPQPCTGLVLTHGDVAAHIVTLPDRAFDAILHDPPRFGIAGELYSRAFYDRLARVIKRKGKLFHYTGTPNKLTSGRDVPNEVAGRLRQAGFATEMNGDGVLAARR